MIRPDHLLGKIIRPTLDYMADNSELPLNSDAAAMLLLGTAAAESKMGEYLEQHPQGPAKGIYQMEVRTYNDLMQWVQHNDVLGEAIKPFIASKPYPTSQQLVGNLYLATAASRLYYWRISESLPQADDLPGLAGYWKKYYNTSAGKGTPEKFLQAWLEANLDKVRTLSV